MTNGEQVQVHTRYYTHTRIYIFAYMYESCWRAVYAYYSIESVWCQAKYFYSVHFVQAANFTRPSRLDRKVKKTKRIWAATYKVSCTMNRLCVSWSAIPLTQSDLATHVVPNYLHVVWYVRFCLCHWSKSERKRRKEWILSTHTNNAHCPISIPYNKMM